MFGKRRDRQPSLEESFAGRLNELDRRLEKLEMESAERQLTVLKTVEKVLYQLRARDVGRKRAQEAEGEPIEAEGEPQYPPQRGYEPTAHLARRLRGI